MRNSELGRLQPVEPGYYELGDTIAQGGMGVIRRAFDRRTGREVAIKQILAGRLEKQSERGRAASLLRFEREARLTAALEHPSIVPVYEIGLLDGAPFFAMQLVADMPLQTVLESKRNLADRLAVLPHLVGVSDALAYAHSQGVIHRDLKPANVLVGAFGETVVIDWGLAKRLGEDEAPALPEGLDTAGAAERGPSAGDATMSVAVDEVPLNVAAAEVGGLTIAGQAMGTAAYMPPEQAAGLAVDERADVYAIGAMLYELLAGRPAYTPTQGSTDPVADVLQRVRLKVPPPPLSTMSPAPPRDLITIVEKAMSAEPRDRYATARELSADLAQFQAGQRVAAHEYSIGELLRRWVRKHRAPVAVAALALVAFSVIAVISVQRIRGERAEARGQQRLAEANRAAAETQQRRAETSRADAETLMSFMLDDLHGELRTIGRTDLLGKVASQAQDYYGRQTSHAGDRVSRAKALSNIGDVLLAQGDLTRARAQYQAARELRELLAGETPRQAPALRQLAETLEALAGLARRQGELSNASELLEAAVTARRQVLELTTDEIDATLELAGAIDAMGGVQGLQGDLDESASHYGDSAELRARAQAKHPDDAEVRAAVARSERNLAEIAWARGEPEEAKKRCKSSREQLAQLLLASPDDSELARDLFRTHLRLGKMHASTAAVGDKRGSRVRYAGADRAKAAADLALALELAQRFASRDRMNATWQSALANAHDAKGDLAMLQGKSKSRQAGEAYREAMHIRKLLSKRNPRNTEFRYLAATSHVKLGGLELADSNPDGAIAELEQALKTIEELAQASPKNSEWALASAQVLAQLARAHRSKKGFEAAQRASERSLAIRQKLAALDATNVRWAQGIAKTYAALGTLMEQRGDDKAALTMHQKSRDLLITLERTHAGNRQLSTLASRQRYAAKACCGQKRPGAPPPETFATSAGTLMGSADFSAGLDDATLYGGLLGDEAGEMQGGFGFGVSGTGAGGGGTGWGTIGTGRYGTMGHGTGTGSGYGTKPGREGMRGRRAQVPTIRIGKATATGDLDVNIIRRYIRRKRGQLLHCYERQLLVKQGLKGTVTVAFMILPAGRVGGAKATGMDETVSACVARTISSIHFPKPKGGGVVQVRYPFTFDSQ